jgi:hypothetical protein
LNDKISSKNDLIDYSKTIERLNNFVLKLVDKIKNGDIKAKTIIIDSASDLWNFIINWGVLYLSDKVNKDGSNKADPDTLKINNMMDWFIPKNMHYKIFQVLKLLTNYGVDIVFTCRDKTMPEFAKDALKKKMGALYTETFKEKIRCEGELPYNCDIIIRHTLSSENKRLSIFEKCFRSGVEEVIIEDITFDKIKKELGEKKCQKEQHE